MNHFHWLSCFKCCQLFCGHCFWGWRSCLVLALWQLYVCPVNVFKSNVRLSTWKKTVTCIVFKLIFRLNMLLHVLISTVKLLEPKWILNACKYFSSTQRDLYDETFRDLVQSVIGGFNGTIFAYGQTGTGKTFTMQGKSDL